MTLKLNCLWILSALLFSICFPAQAQAYIDPSCGSYAIQGIFGVFFAVSFYCKGLVQWFFARKRSS